MLESIVMFMFLQFGKPIYCDTVLNTQVQEVIAEKETTETEEGETYAICQK